METNFKEFKDKILNRAKVANTCVGEYKKAYNSETFSELMQVIKDNFNFAYTRKVIDAELIKEYESIFNENKIFCNVDVSEGFLLACDSATVKAWGSATVEAYDSATVEAYDSATVKAYDSATVKAYDSATVEAYGSAYIQSYSIIECKLGKNAIYRIRELNTIRYASDDIRFERV